MEEILIEDYNYPLPDERIAKYPLAERDQSKLLVYRDGQVEEDTFCHVGEYLPAGSLLIYNNTRVIQARLEFFKNSLGVLISPEGSNDYSQANVQRFRGSEVIVLKSHEEAVKSKRVHAENFRIIETESNKIKAATIVQAVGNQCVVVNPPYPTMSSEELDAIYDLPFMYHPHPKYKDKHIPAYEMIRFSVCMHRGCFGGCSFCTISAHQGKQITSRSEQNILRQIDILKDLPEWKGYLSDLGGPSANMYGMHGKDMSLCEKCARPSCLYPSICKNLNQDFAPLLHIYNKVDQLPYITKAFVGSGVRYDLMTEEYGKQLITRHVSGRLKVAPEHTSDNVLKIMRKPSWEQYERFHRFFECVNKEAGLRQQLIPYFISSHPGCTNKDMQQLAERCKQLHYRPEQVQDFTPTPMTLATTMFYTGLNPYTLEEVYVAKTKEEKQKQNSYFFWWKDNIDRNAVDRTKRPVKKGKLTKAEMATRSIRSHHKTRYGKKEI